MLNNYFSSVCTWDDGLTPDVLPLVSQNDGIDNISFSPVFVDRALRKLKPSHSCGPDGLPSVLYNTLSKSVVHALSLIFKSFISIGKEWHSAIVTPLRKGGLASIISNYRSISLTRVASKVMERVVVVNLLTYRRYRNLISKPQHGFLVNLQPPIFSSHLLSGQLH